MLKEDLSKVLNSSLEHFYKTVSVEENFIFLISIKDMSYCYKGINNRPHYSKFLTEKSNEEIRELLLDSNDWIRWILDLKGLLGFGSLIYGGEFWNHTSLNLNKMWTNDITHRFPIPIRSNFNESDSVNTIVTDLIFRCYHAIQFKTFIRNPKSKRIIFDIVDLNILNQDENTIKPTPEWDALCIDILKEVSIKYFSARVFSSHTERETFLMGSNESNELLISLYHNMGDKKPGFLKCGSDLDETIELKTLKKFREQELSESRASFDTFCHSNKTYINIDDLRKDSFSIIATGEIRLYTYFNFIFKIFSLALREMKLFSIKELIDFMYCENMKIISALQRHDIFGINPEIDALIEKALILKLK
ncbi:MAG: hypothetical protein KBA66_20190 [Leptospiraceae bacterium]|nr:hypothetical protein [Leptospiraceae bacterium]